MDNAHISELLDAGPVLAPVKLKLTRLLGQRLVVTAPVACVDTLAAHAECHRHARVFKRLLDYDAHLRYALKPCLRHRRFRTAVPCAFS